MGCVYKDIEKATCFFSFSFSFSDFLPWMHAFSITNLKKKKKKKWNKLHNKTNDQFVNDDIKQQYTYTHRLFSKYENSFWPLVRHQLISLKLHLILGIKSCSTNTWVWPLRNHTSISHTCFTYNGNFSVKMIYN